MIQQSLFALITAQPIPPPIAAAASIAGANRPAIMIAATVGAATTTAAPTATTSVRQATSVPTGSEITPEMQTLLLSSTLDLDDAQATALHNFVEVVGNRTAERVIPAINWTQIRRVRVTDFRVMRGGVCQVARSRNQAEGHKLRYLYTIRLEEGEESSDVSFGATCLEHVIGLTPEERAIARGLDLWVRDSSQRAIIHMLAKAHGQGISARHLVNEWRQTAEYQQFIVDSFAIFEAADDAAPASLKGKTEGASGRRRVQAIGRALAATEAAMHLERADLPVPPEILRRITLAATRIRENSK